MKIKPIFTALAVALAAIVQPALAGFTQDANGNPTHYNGIPIPPMQTVAEARAATEKRLAAIHAEEAKQGAQAATELATRNPSPATAPQELFFTGKPYLEETGQYLFLFRHYDPELARWTTADPSGFPDGANNIAYMAVPTNEFDWQGLAIMTASQGVDHYLNGNGQPVVETFSDYYSEVNYNAYDFEGFHSAFSSSTSGALNLTRLSNFGELTAFGRVTFRLTGNISTDSSNKYFNGNIQIDGEWYNFDARPWGERSLPAEVATRIGGFVLGDLLGGERFWGTWNGSHPISITVPYE